MSDNELSGVTPLRVQRVIRKRDLPQYVGVERTAVEAMVARGEFPRPIKLSERAVGWLEDDLLRWQQQRIAERDAVNEPAS